MVYGVGFRMWGLGLRDKGSGFRVQGLGFRFWGLGVVLICTIPMSVINFGSKLAL
jgi:hypothetical protein